ncbi:metallophosphoesterase family protein [Fundicoccus culcitae]|uniref:DNA repair exonuclease n=1 Tax=Fundicoccus culcitae TaxID=2969821 RepID=A0ABY5P5B6_9LACT|nr:DNA repair exonuclease [Fundicoccus culcitae]UUX33939.1 DNA repair exonuclease [Fundicoccus culcitae]
MAKILHVADLHLDSPFVGLDKQISHLQKPLIEAPYQAFSRCVSIAINQKVDVLIIVGDIYDSSKQTIYAQHFFAKQLERLDKVHIPVVLVNGNHDYIQNNQPILYPFDNVHQITTEEVTHVDITLKNQETIRFYGFSYNRRWIPERKIEQFPINPSETDYTVGMLHGDMASQSSKVGNYAPFTIQELSSKNYNYWALGHIHQSMTLSQNPLIQYSGTIQGRNRLETGDKGAFLIDLEKNQPAKSEFISLAKIVYENVTIDCQYQWQALDLVEKINEAVSNYRLETVPNQQSYLLNIILDNAQRLPIELQEQVESGELLTTVSDVTDDNLFVVVISIVLNKQMSLDAFQYDPKLNDSYKKAVQELETNQLYEDIMKDVFNHSVMRSRLTDLVEDADLKANIIKEAQELLIQSIGFDVEGVDHED